MISISSAGRRPRDDLSRANVMRQAASLDHLKRGMLLPGITISTSRDDYFPIKQMQLLRFTGEHAEMFGSVMTGAEQ
jgi:branched-chain amino acid transport system substrate-binding protein